MERCVGIVRRGNCACSTASSVFNEPPASSIMGSRRRCCNVSIVVTRMETEPSDPPRHRLCSAKLVNVIWPLGNVAARFSEGQKADPFALEMRLQSHWPLSCHSNTTCAAPRRLAYVLEVANANRGLSLAPMRVVRPNRPAFQTLGRSKLSAQACHFHDTTILT
jgi:hypothetical protein